MLASSQALRHPAPCPAAAVVNTATLKKSPPPAVEEPPMAEPPMAEPPAEEPPAAEPPAADEPPMEEPPPRELPACWHACMHVCLRACMHVCMYGPACCAANAMRACQQQGSIVRGLPWAATRPDACCTCRSCCAMLVCWGVIPTMLQPWLRGRCWWPGPGQAAAPRMACSMTCGG